MTKIDNHKILEIEEVISKLTIDEKISQLLNISGPIKRFKIPEYDWRNECLQGVAFRGDASIFPGPIALAASWDTNLVYNVASAISDEARAKHHYFANKSERGRWQGLTFSCPNINIFRDPRWGRGQETFGEDPYLTSKMGVAFVNGLQGDNEQLFKVIAEPKHFAVHSGPEKIRHSINIKVSKKDLYETYLPAFRACIKEANAAGIMSAYNRLNGEPCSASGVLLQQILRKEFGFKGYVIGDGGAVTDIYKNHKLVNSLEEAVALAINNGCDIINPMNLSTSAKLKRYRKAIKKAFENNLISEQKIEHNLRRVLIARLKLGLFRETETEYSKIPIDIVHCVKHQDLALQAARKSIVLLKNERDFLPLMKNVKSIALLGPLVDDQKAFYYFHYYPGKYEIKTYLQEINNLISPNTKLYHDKAIDITEFKEKEYNEGIYKAEKANIVLLFLGLTARLEGEEGYVIGPNRGDRLDLELPKAQEQFLKDVIKVNKNTILIINSGSAVALSHAKKNFPAIIQGWYPGEKGASAILDVIFGKYNPAGRLPITFYRSVKYLPDFENYDMKGRTYRYINHEALFSFGHGLSYSRFIYQNLSIKPKKIKPNGNIKISFIVTNISQIEGEEVIQLYLTYESDNNDVPIRSLRRFKRINLKAGEKEDIIFVLDKNDYSIINSLGKNVIKSGRFLISVGGSQPDDKKNGCLIDDFEIE